jgi:dTDP-4-dehydrorhamnose 3,5-epimerase
MHLQVHPAPEAKLVRCMRGAILDVAADLRPGSATFGHWVGVTLTEENGDALYVPEGFAHGFQALSDGAAILYDTTAPYTPEAVRGARHDDPVLDIRWPLPISVISQQDREWPLLDAEWSQGTVHGPQWPAKPDCGRWKDDRYAVAHDIGADVPTG